MSNRFAYTPLALALSVAGISAPALAEEAFSLEEIVVTAQKRAENVQDIGATVNAMGADALNDFSVQNFTDIESLTPGLSLNSADTRSKSIALRGVSYDPEGSGASTVATYLNGASVRANVLFAQTFDIDRIEVLRGPQGTLQGKTSPSGALIVHTKKPDMDVIEGEILQTFDSQGSNSQFGVSLPIIDGELAVRLAGAYTDSELEGVRNPVTGTDDGKLDRAGRLTVVWEPSDVFNAQLTYEHSESRYDGYEAIAGNGLGATIGTFDRIALTTTDGLYEAQNRISSLQMNWEVMGHELTSVTGYSATSDSDYRDRSAISGGSGLALLAQPQRVEIQFDTFTQELRLASLDTEFWEYMMGAYYERQQASTFYSLDSGLGSLVAPNILDNREEFGLFSQNTFHLSDETRLQAGIRWSKYRLRNNYDFNIDLSFALQNPAFIGSGISIPVSAIDIEQGGNTSESVTGGLKLLHDLSEETMIYASLDSSYRPGGAFIEPTLTSGNDILFGEESSQSIELGFKSSLWDNRAQINAAIFYQRFDDYISRITDVAVDANLDTVADNTRASGIVFNGDAIIQGAELDFKMLLTQNWSLGGGLSYTDAKYDGAVIPCSNGSFDGASAIAKCSVDGQRIGGEPNWSASLNSEYSVPMEKFEGYVRGLYKFTDSRANDDIPDGDVTSYGVVNLFAGVRSHDSQWEVSAFAKNLFDKQAEVRRRPIDAYGYRKVDLLPERIVGLSGKYNFSL